MTVVRLTPHSRLLACTQCRQAVEVFELPREHVNPDTYVCAWCLQKEQA